MTTVRLLAILLLAAATASSARGDDVFLKRGLLYRGAVDRDNTLRQVSDGLKRVVIRDSRIERIAPSDPFRNLERFQIVQPLEVHAGAMPAYAIAIRATPWDAKGRRSFRYVGPRGPAPVVMNQAINDLGPHMVRYRGIDGFWVGQVATGQVPREIILGLLARVDQTILNERQRVARFLLEAEWFDEAETAVEGIARDFPAEAERSERLLRSIRDLDARRKLVEIDLTRRSRRPAALLAKLRGFPTQDVAPEVLADVRDQLRRLEAEAAEDRKAAGALHELVKALPSDRASTWDRRLSEILKALEAAPDALRSRLDAFRKAETGAEGEARLALAMSGWVVGPDAAVSDLDAAGALWDARSALVDYLRTGLDDEAGRSDALARLRPPGDAPEAAGASDLHTITRIVQRMAPPQHDDRAVGGMTLINRVADDTNPEPTEYHVRLPPEYHPLRKYPTVVALHDGSGPASAVDWWAAEAARRGYIVVAPEYNLKGKPRDYRYSPSEHAAVELSLRDARKRYAIDSDRVYLGGSLLGANMALDFGLAHPDLFAGVASVGGLPAKYAYPYGRHTEIVPLYFAIGELAPAVKELIFDGFAKPLVVSSPDVTYVEYARRGLEDLPEEAPAIFDWMDTHARDPAPKSFEAYSARPSDARYFGVVIQGHAAGRTIAPEAADPLGKNVRPARVSMRTSGLSNLLNVSSTGVDRLDVWVSPRLIDFRRRLEVRINGRSFYKGLPKPDPAPMLTDLRYRGDREQVYWLKVSTAR